MIGQNSASLALAGVFGRTASTVSDARYSDAMKESGIVWDEETLEEFLTAPRQAVPGTTMNIGVPNAERRTDVIAYLKTSTTP